MKSVHTILSSLLAGMMMFSLAACTASGTGASGSDSSAVQTDAVPRDAGWNGRLTEFPPDWYSARRPPHWQMAVLYCMPGMRVPICRSLSVSTPRIMVPAGSLRLWTGPKNRHTGTLGCPPGRHRGVYNHRLHPVGRTIGRQPGSAGPGRGRGNFYLNQMGFLPDGTLVAVRQADRVFLCREIFCFMMWMPKR